MPPTRDATNETGAQTTNQSDVLEGRLGVDHAGLYSRPTCAGCAAPLHRPAAATSDGRVFCGECAENSAEEDA